MDITIEHKNSCCGRGLIKGSQEAKDWAKKMADIRKAKQVITKQNEPKVNIELMGEPQLILPEYFAIPRKNGYKLVNPVTQERNLSKRQGKMSIKILRKPVENAILLEGNNDLIPLSSFSKKDRDLIVNHFDKIEQNKNKSVQQKPIIQMTEIKERGRPERLLKNIEINKERNEGKSKKGRPVKYKTLEDAKKAKALSDKARYIKKQEAKKKANEPVIGSGMDTHTHPDGTIMTGKKHTKSSKILVEGDGIMTDIGNIIRTGDRKVRNTIKRVSSIAKEVFYGANELPRQVQEILQRFGNEEITSMIIMRTPVPQVLTGALSLFSGGEFGKKMKENDFDELFHLFLEVKLINGNRIQIEKNERINMIINPKSRPKTEIEPIKETLPSKLTLNIMMANTERYMGKNKFLGYSARDNNCQDFLSAVLQSNNLGDNNDISFIKQDTKSLFEDLPYLRKFSNTLTDIGAKVNAVVSGGKIKKVKDIENITMTIMKGKGLTEKNIYDNNIIMKDTRFNPPTGSMADSRFFNINQFIPLSKEQMKRQMEKMSGMGAHMDGMGMGHMSGCSTCPTCGSGIFDKIGKAFKKVGNTIKGGVEKTIIQPTKKTFTPNLGREITSGLIHRALPAAISGIASTGTTALTGNPYLGFAVGQTAGRVAGKKAGDELGKTTGYGVKKPNAWIEMVKKVQKDQGVTYKEAMSIASQMKQKN